MLCIQSGQAVTLSGYTGSDVYEYLSLHIHACNQTLDGNCDTPSNINTYMTNYLNINDYFKVKFFVLDTLISPDTHDAITHVL